jgi:hypothetical protein
MTRISLYVTSHVPFFVKKESWKLDTPVLRGMLVVQMSLE